MQWLTSRRALWDSRSLCQVKSRSLQLQSQLRKLQCVRLTNEKTQPQTSNRAASFRFRLQFLPLLRVPGPVFVTILPFANNSDASAVCCVVSTFPTIESVLSSHCTLDTSHSLFPCCLCPRLCLQCSCLCSTNSLSRVQLPHSCDRFANRCLGPCLSPSTLHQSPLVELQSSMCSFWQECTILLPQDARE